MKNYKIAVAGTGYVGLSLGVLLSQHHQVVAVDIVQAKVDMINNKKSPIQDDYIEKYLAEKDLNLTATLDAKAAYSDADFVVIAAPTNYDSKTQHFDTSAVEAVIKLVMEYNPNAIMVIKSTIPVGYEVVSNKATNDYRETSLAKSRVIVRKPKVPVTEKNYKALQFLDMLKDVDVYSEVTGKPLQERLYRYMDDAHLSISEMEPYFAYYPDKLYKNLVETRVIYKDIEEEILLEIKKRDGL